MKNLLSNIQLLNLLFNTKRLDGNKTMKIYIPNISNTTLGGGFSFIRNFRKALKEKVDFVNNWQECDIIFVFGITTMDKGEVLEAVKAGKKFVLRVDNIPRKSRNRRQSPSERLREFGKLGTVVYQSNWCKEFAGYFAGEGTIINNGVDISIFNKEDRNSDGNTYLYINFNDNPNKRFDEAIYLFEMAWRKNNEIKLIVAGNAPKIYLENPEYNWDLNVPAKVEYADILKSPQEVSNLMKKCDFLLVPYFCEAYSNVLLESLACGLKPIGVNPTGGNIEMLENSKDGVKSIEQMGDEYYNLFKTI